MRTRWWILLVVCAAFSPIAAGAGYGPWTFGMTKQEVRAITQYGPYYEFQNGDIGTRAGTFDETQAPVSFYFKGDRLIRVMVVVYSGPSFDETAKAWRRAFQHIERNFDAVEVPSIRRGPTNLVSAERALEQSGLRDGRDTKLQMGATPMPKDRVVWCTLNVVPSSGYWVALSYAEP